MKVTILIPTYNRTVALAATLTALVGQAFKDFNIVIADQSDIPVGEDATIQTISRILTLRGNTVQILENKPRQGIAHQRQTLLDHANSDFVLFIDDDVILEPPALQNLVRTMEEDRCGFVGMALIGLSYQHDVRPHEQRLERWADKVEPEVVRPGSKAWERYKLHNAANVLHVAHSLIGEGEVVKYKVAWVGGCILYDRAKLLSVGGFNFWQHLPHEHCGEDVLVQLRLMEKYGGCGLLPSYAYHQELETTLHDRSVNAPECLL